MTRRPTLWFITPAWQRLEMSAVCFAQRAWCIDRLRAAGIDANACIVADDGNLDLAREHGFAFVDRPNDGLGAKFNDGYQFAAAEQIDFVCPMGSDSWVHPTFIAAAIDDAGEREQIGYSRHYATVRADGLARARHFVDYVGGTTMVFPTSLLRYAAWRPIPEKAPRGCDTHTMNAIRRTAATLAIHERHQLETIAFQTELQITSYQKLYERWGVEETTSPFDDLASIYPADLVEQMRTLYRARATAA